ncbi:MAG: hypothetical protein ACFCBU_08625 [Cyanophyceae cyanobacterium]
MIASAPIDYGKIAARNGKVLAQLANSIYILRGRFKLILAIAESSNGCDRWGVELTEFCRAEKGLDVDTVNLGSGDFAADSFIENWDNHTQKPDALQVVGINRLEDIDEFWVPLNQSRDRLPDILKLPVILWLNQQSLGRMVIVANDLHSWATSKRFHTELQDYQADLRLGLTRLFERLEHTTNEAVILRLESAIADREWEELTTAYATLTEAEVGIDPELEAGIIFGRGRLGLHSDEPDLVLENLDQARDRLQGIVGVENWLGWVEWHRGIAKLLQLERDFKQLESVDLVDVLSEVRTCFQSAIFLWEVDEESSLSVAAYDWETNHLVTSRLQALQAQEAGNVEEEVQNLKFAEWVSPFCFPQLALDGLKRLETVLLQEKQDYLAAFKVGRHRREGERVYGLRSFIGVARLVPLRVEGRAETVPPEIEFSGRAEDLDAIIDKIRGNDTKLVVLCGSSGVGKST